MQKNTRLSTEIVQDVLKKLKSREKAIVCLMSENVALSVAVAACLILILIRDRGRKK